MRIPPLYNDKSWQRFFAGIILGMLIGWLFFLYHFGMVHEKLILELNDKKSMIEKHERTIDILRQDQDEQSQENQDKLKVQEIKVEFLNEEEVNLSEMTIHDLRGAIETELEQIRNRQIEAVAASRDLLEKAVENKIYRVGGDKQYQLKIEKFILHTTLELFVRIEPASLDRG
ncbi:sporulation membrane protein YtrI [Evansella tamaricis]|uniref:Sporulation membrane protein YtrI C-terminal domain-containing protein n=1 Tax=Evansella tamaricis TaxID=2069301 RepID=A0ABS6JH26_9BACI|nr:sporulation membrane protein YtrI [Evansella tamaricis]MBU9712932.1 hypothetical protein [Evansella tamaricis]